jgi:hypothetical protein
MKKKSRTSKHQMTFDEKIIAKEKEYLKDILQRYILENAVYTTNDLRFDPEPDFKTALYMLVLDHILQNFRFDELFMIFCTYPADDFSEKYMREIKKAAIDSIDDIDLPEREIKKLKKKVWDMNKILFGLIHELIMKSNPDFEEEVIKENAGRGPAKSTGIAEGDYNNLPF